MTRAGGDDLINLFYVRDEDSADEANAEYEAHKRLIMEETATDLEEQAF